MDFNTLVYNAMLTIITTGFPVLIAYLVSFIKQHTNAKQLQTANIIAKNAILFTEQISKDMKFDGSTKLNSAINSAEQLAKNYGINLNQFQWRSLIEASLNEINKGYNDVLNPSSVASFDTFVPSDSSGSLNSTEVIAVENVQNTEANPKLALPEDMLTPLYASILDKSNEKAKLAVEQVITDITKSITVEGEK